MNVFPSGGRAIRIAWSALSADPGGVVPGCDDGRNVVELLGHGVSSQMRQS